MFHFDPKRDQLDIDMFYRTAKILRGWDSDKMGFDILDIYGINFDALLQTMGGIRKKKKRKKQSNLPNPGDLVPHKGVRLFSGQRRNSS